jgi:hypothetical protein
MRRAGPAVSAGAVERTALGQTTPVTLAASVSNPGNLFVDGTAFYYTTSTFGDAGEPIFQPHALPPSRISFERWGRARVVAWRANGPATPAVDVALSALGETPTRLDVSCRFREGLRLFLPEPPGECASGPRPWHVISPAQCERIG